MVAYVCIQTQLATHIYVTRTIIIVHATNATKFLSFHCNEYDFMVFFHYPVLSAHLVLIIAFEAALYLSYFPLFHIMTPRRGPQVLCFI